MNIIESIGKWGVISTPQHHVYKRLQTPKSGDIVEFTDTDYPHTQGKYGRINDFGLWRKNKYHICCGLGSAFLWENGNVTISGGPFESVKPEELIPKMETKLAQYWNWGNNLAGADQGVYYWFERPVFVLQKIK